MLYHHIEVAFLISLTYIFFFYHILLLYIHKKLKYQIDQVIFKTAFKNLDQELTFMYYQWEISEKLLLNEFTRPTQSLSHQLLLALKELSSLLRDLALSCF